VKPPNWLAEIIAAHGARVLDGKATRADGDAAVMAAVRDHPEFGTQLAAALAAGLFGRWLREHTSSGDLFQAQPFPGLPTSMLVGVARPLPVHAMTAADLDHAKNMLHARVDNAIKGATEALEKERATFDAFYEQVYPLLKGDKTVADVLPELAAKAA
jgi:hypothetical protein